MKSFGEGFDQELEGLPGKPGALITRSEGRQPAAVVLDVEPFDPDRRPPKIDQPRVQSPK